VDAHDADDFYRVLADEVAPLYYQRDEAGLPAGWIDKARHSIRSSLVRFSSYRMVADYVDLGYAPLSR
jgi:glycogen phosphorylase